jgi:hypothetical protein
MGIAMTAADAMLDTLINALEDSAAGHAYVAEEADGFGLYAHCEFQAFERRRLAALLVSRRAASGSTRTSSNDTELSGNSIVNLKIARVHGDSTVISQLQRNDARLSHMLQASLVDGGLKGEIGQTVRAISSAVSDAQAELAILSRRTRLAPHAEARSMIQAA